jgi:hypothetical protein
MIAPKRTRQQAINAKCKDCIYDHLAGGTWRDQVERCGGTDCPLYPHRPGTLAHRGRAPKSLTFAVNQHCGSDLRGMMGSANSAMAAPLNR